MATTKYCDLFKIIALYLLLCCATALADPPKYVYRADFRDPDDVFINGFRPLGGNDNLIDHVTGASCYTGKRDTAFIATSTSEQFAMQWGKDRTVVNRDKNYFYVYQIRATDNFYDAHQSLLEAYHNTRDSNYQALASHYQYQEEWLAFNGIAASQIRSVKVYGTPDGSGHSELIKTQLNQYYVDTSSQGNENSYPIRGNAPRTNWLLQSALAYLTACFSLCRPSSNSELSYDATTCPKAYQHSIIDNELGAIWNTFTQRPILNTVPWDAQTLTHNVRSHHYYSPTCCTVAMREVTNPDLMEISCDRCSKYFRNFVVRLEAYGPINVWVNQTFKDGEVHGNWKKGSNELSVVGTSYTIKDYGYSIADVFRSGYGWSSTMVSIYPVYPAV